jgi:chromate transporter
MTSLTLYWLFARAALLSFTGFATVPIVRDALVIDHHLLTDAQLNDAIAISQASPGPIGMYIVVVGYFVNGWQGALAGALSLATPALLSIPIARLVLRGRSALLEGACSGVIIAFVCLDDGNRPQAGASGQPDVYPRGTHRRRESRR